MAEKQTYRLTRELVFVDPLTLPVGFRIEPVTGSDHADIQAARSCATRVAHETGEKPVICLVKGCLRVI